MLMLIGLTMEDECRLSSRELDALLADTAAGSQAALAGVYRCARGAVYAMALSYLKNAQDAQDVTQDTFVRIWEYAAGYRPQGSPMAWMLAIARNLCLMKLRREARQTSLTDEEWNAIPADSAGASPEDRQVLQDALAGLADEERRIVLLHAAAGLKHREIARLLELPLPTVLSKYRRALKKMKAQLEGGCAL